MRKRVMDSERASRIISGGGLDFAINHQKSDVKQPKSPAATHALTILYLSPWMLTMNLAVTVRL